VTVFQKLKTERLPEIIENAIIDFILKEGFNLGDRLPNEKDMARQFGVSISTMREALRGLEIYGVIEKKRGKSGGIFVGNYSSFLTVLRNFFKLNSFKNKDIHQVRQIIEPAVAEIAASCITPKNLQALEKNIKYCESKVKGLGEDISEGDFYDIEDKNIEFHALIAEATQNPVLILMVKYVLYLLVSYKKDLLAPDLSFAMEVVNGHLAIFKCLKNHDVQKAGEIMRAHLQDSAGYLDTKKPH